MEDSKRIRYYTVTTQPTLPNAEGDTFYFTDKEEANKFMVSDFFEKEYGRNAGKLNDVSFDIYDTAQGLIDASINKLKESGLSKLTDKEKRALGLL